MRAARRVAVLAMLLAALGATAVPATASPESTFVSRINASRAAAGLAPLEVNADLVDDAAAWSQRMLEAGAISHNPNLGSVTTGWEALGENVGVGPDEGSLHDAFMGSSGHRQNILGDFTHVGVGVVAEPERMWVTVIFMKAAGAPAPTTTTTVPVAVAATTVAVTTSAADTAPTAPQRLVEYPVVTRTGRAVGLVPRAV